MLVSADQAQATCATKARDTLLDRAVAGYSLALRDRSAMQTIAITGACGLVGQRLLEALLERVDVGSILALDLELPVIAVPGVDARVADVRDPGLAEILAGCDALVHLAFVSEPRRDVQAMREANVEGTKNVMQCAAEAGVARVVHLSSAMAYGARPDNAIPLTEDAPLRATAALAQASHKAEIERWLWEWAAQPGRPSVAALRPSIVTGPGLDNMVTRWMETPPFLTVRGHQPPVQFTHVDDVVSAVILLLDQSELTGPMNCASQGWLSHDEFLAVSGVRHVELPLEVAHQLAKRTWSVGLSPVPPGYLEYAMHPWVVDVQRLAAAGWRPRHTNREALQELVREHREHLSLGPVRIRRQDMRRGALVTGALGVGALAVRTIRGRG
ncbi:MAG: nucleoside-diphosphate-sugar epimerase [Glaciecola sp.]|jgi:nucleoside-diphosphate-sugar epimerase